MDAALVSEFRKISTLDLIAAANRERQKWMGSRFELCSIMNVKSGSCSEDCKFCAQSSRYKTTSPVFPLVSVDEMLHDAERAKMAGAERFGLVASGRNLSNKEIETIAEGIRRIRQNVEIAVCASLGILKKDSLMLLKESGLSRYHHNIETSQEFFPRIASTHLFSDRMATLKSAGDAGLEVCSGGIIGMGEGEDDRIRMAQVLREADVDSVPLNILVPIAGTPLAGISPLTVEEILRTVAMFRLILKNKTIRIAAGRETALKDFQGMAFLAGANAMMIGGYLTIQGREVAEDHKLVEEVKKLWNG
ncbi:MAG: biotin synthase BioB [bacterium]